MQTNFDDVISRIIPTDDLVREKFEYFYRNSDHYDVCLENFEVINFHLYLKIEKTVILRKFKFKKDRTKPKKALIILTGQNNESCENLPKTVLIYLNIFLIRFIF